MSSSTMIPNVNKQDFKQEWAPAAEKAKEVAASVGDLAGKAATAVGAMASQAACDVGSMASHAACDVGKKADDLTVSAGIGIQGLGDRLSKSASQTGVLGSATQAVAKTVKDGGEYLEGAKFSGMAEDVAELIKKNPIPAVFIGIGLGWFAARALRS